MQRLVFLPFWSRDHSWGTLVVFVGLAHSARPLRVLRSSRAGEQAVGVKEIIYGVPFVVAGLVFAFVSVRHSAVVVGVFWLLHGLYDLVHSQLITNIGVPGWYPIWCFMVDAVIGSYLLWLSRRVPDANLRQA